jgi:hypothetical protein
LPTFQTRLFQDAGERSWREIIRCFARHRNTPGLPQMFVLPMTPFGRNQEPAIFLEHADDLTHFHDTTIQNASLALLKIISPISATSIEWVGWPNQLPGVNGK